MAADELDNTPGGPAEPDAPALDQVVSHEPDLSGGMGAVLATSPDGVIVIDERGVVETFSTAAERIFGYGAAEVVGKNVKMLMPEPYHGRHDDYMSNYLKTGQRKIIGLGRVVVGRRKDGSSFPMELAVGETSLSGRRIFTGFIRDVTSRQLKKQRLQDLQAELLHASRLSVLGELSSGLAHELNQPLTAISNFAQAGRHFLKRPGQTEKTDEILAKIGGQARRASDIIRKLRSFVRKGEVERRLEDLNAVFEEAAGLALVGTADENISVVWALAKDLPDIQMDRIQIQQVMLNLIRNGIDAMADSEIRELRLESRRIDQDMAEVLVGDTGPGVPDEVRPQLFIPFQTTKSDGLGIGLSICRTIVVSHGGELDLAGGRTGGGNGATFRFTLPIVGEPESSG